MSCGVGVLAESSTTLKAYLRPNCHLKEPHFMNIRHTYTAYTSIKGIYVDLFLTYSDLDVMICYNTSLSNPQFIAFLPNSSPLRLSIFVNRPHKHDGSLTFSLHKAPHSRRQSMKHCCKAVRTSCKLNTTTQGISVVFGWWLLARKMRWVILIK